MGSTKLFAVASNEAAVLAEWIHHHLYFGFDEIEIALNRTTDNSNKILEKINAKNKNIKVRCIDDFVDHSLKTGQHFQIEIYRECLESANNFFDYTMFLDLDEYWVPCDFYTGIKEYISGLPKFDTASFLWHIDIPAARDPFQLSFSKRFQVYKDRHVKSLISTKRKPEYLTSHNAVFDSGTALLANYGYFSGGDDSHFNSKISVRQFEEIKERQDSAYVLHRIFKSDIEYLASLLRNTPTTLSYEVLKTNRNGYYIPSDTPFITKHIGEENFEKYYNSWKEFVRKNSLELEILEAQRSTYNNAATVARMVSENEALFKRYEMQLFGCELAIEKLRAVV